MEYITNELVRAVPVGWKVEFVADRGAPGSAFNTFWSIARTQVPEGEWPIQEYNVYMPASLEFVIFTHGNNDVGAMSLDQLLQHARIIEAWVLRRYGMHACLECVMSTCKPNQWGYT